MSTYISTTPRSLLQPLAFQGLLACQCHTQLTERLRARLGAPYAALFAEPMFDEMQGHIDWYTASAGTIRPFQELSEQEQVQAQMDLAGFADTLHTFAAELKALEDNASQIAGHIIELALTFPDENSIYLVDTQIVLVAWGFTPANVNTKPYDISRIVRHELKQNVPPAAPITPPTSPVTNPVASPVTDPVFVEASRSLWNRWWLLPLFFLVLCALLFYFKGPISAFFAPSMKTSLASLGVQRDALHTDLLARAAECKEIPLEIPKEATGDMAFLEGRWRCKTTLINTRTGKTVAVEYLFDGKGQGSMSIVVDKGLCEAKATASMKDANTLAILTDPVIACPEGSSYTGQSIECVRDAGGVRCQGQNQPSSTPWDAEFYRLNEASL